MSPAALRLIKTELEANLNRRADQLPSISVVGLGYVGAVSIACLSDGGHRVVGVDVDSTKVDAISNGVAPIVEAGLNELLGLGLERNLISAHDDLRRAVLETDVTFISVGTPTSKDGGCDFTAIEAVSDVLGEAIRDKGDYHLVVMRCSIPPGTTTDVVCKRIERVSGKSLGEDFGVCFNPEFLREGTAIDDFYAPPKTVIGASDERAANLLADIYRPVDPNPIVTTIAVAEMVKYVDNVWHATKVTFANEVGRLCKPMMVDSHAVMDIFVQDTKLNLSPYYLKPGFAFGGSCLPKEVRAVEHLARSMDVRTPLISSLTRSNTAQVEEAAKLVRKHHGKRIGFLGITFKPNTDDLRESPTLDLMANLMDEGFDIAAYDANLSSDTAIHVQADYIRHAKPLLADLMERLDDLLADSLDAVLDGCDVLVVSHATDQFRTAVKRRRPGVEVIDLARLFKTALPDPAYAGIGW